MTRYTASTLLPHETEVGDYLTEEDEFYASCSCGWNTHPARIRTEPEAALAAAAHVSVQRRLADKRVARIVAVYRNHESLIPMTGGQLTCKCGAWAVNGHPIGASTAQKLWLVHFAEKMMEATAS